MDLLEIMQDRRSVRTYTGEPVSEEKMNKILQAALLAPSSKGSKPWNFIVVKNRDTLSKLSEARDGAAKMLNNAFAAIVVVGNEEASDVWTEDCAIVMSNMHLMADSLGVGSCWIQGRLRKTAEGQTTEKYIRDILEIPDNYRLEAMLSVGMPQNHGKRRELEELNFDKVHYEKF